MSTRRVVFLALAIAVLWAPSIWAAPTVSIVAHRTRGPAPLYVHFDATGTTSSIATDKPFFDLLYEWDFDDSLSGNWETNGLPRNRAIGGVAAHVFERPGVYVVQLKVTDRAGAVVVQTVTISVDDPDVQWAATTACVSSSGTFDGCPSGAATQISGDFTAAMQARVAAGARRILFRRGETFVANTRWSTPGTLKGEQLVSAFGNEADPDPVIEISASNTNGAILLSGTSVSARTSGGWRFVDLRITSPAVSNPGRGIATSFAVGDILLVRMDIGPTGTGFNFASDQSGLSVPHENIAVIDTRLRGNDPIGLGNNGACWFGGAKRLFISGVVCEPANFWQMRITWLHLAVIQNNVVKDVRGDFEATKLHCSKDSISELPDDACRNMVYSDNVLEKARLNIAAAASSDVGSIQDSLFERNVVKGCMEIENPNNVLRHNVSTCVSFKPRNFDAIQPRNNLVENATCDGRGAPVSCISVNPGAIVDGLVVRNVLAYSPGPTPRPLVANNGAGLIAQQSSVSTNVIPWANGNPDPLVAADYELAIGSPHINAGVNSIGRRLDALSRLAPSGSAPDLGALEFPEGGDPEPPDTTPPAPGAVTAVQVVP